MTGFYGADSEALRTMSSIMARRSEAVADLSTALHSVIDSIEWIGEDADEFRADWTGRVRPNLEDCSFELRDRARRLLDNADEQDGASTVDAPGAFTPGGSGGGAGGGSGSGGSGGDGGAGDGGAGTLAALEATGGLGDAVAGTLLGNMVAPALDAVANGAISEGLASVLGLTDGPGGGFGEMLGQVTQAVRDALVGDGSTPLQQALASVLDTPLGRIGLATGLLSSMFGPAVGGMIGGALTAGLMFDQLMSTLNPGPMVGDAIGFDGELSGLESGVGRGDSVSDVSSSSDALTDSASSSGESGSGSDAGGSGGGESGGGAGGGGESGGGSGGGESGGGAGGGSGAGESGGGHSEAPAEAAGPVADSRAHMVGEASEGGAVTAAAPAGRVGSAIGTGEEDLSILQQLLQWLSAAGEFIGSPGASAGAEIGSRLRD